MASKNFLGQGPFQLDALIHRLMIDLMHSFGFCMLLSMRLLDAGCDLVPALPVQRSPTFRSPARRRSFGPLNTSLDHPVKTFNPKISSIFPRPTYSVVSGDQDQVSADDQCNPAQLTRRLSRATLKVTRYQPAV